MVYSGEDFTFVTAVNIPGSDSHSFVEHVGVAVNPETNRVYATWSGDNTLHLIDGDTHEIIDSVSPSSFSETVMVNSYTNYVYVGDAVLDGETLEEVSSNYYGVLKEIDPVSNVLYTTLYEEIFALNGSTHAVLDSLEVSWWISSYSDLVAVNSKTSKIYMANDVDSEVEVLIPESPVWMCMALALFVIVVAVSVYKQNHTRSTSKFARAL